MNKLKEYGNILLGWIIFAVIIFIVFFIFTKGVGYIDQLTSFLIRVTNILSGICFVIFLPLSFFRKTKIVSTYIIYLSSYIFGLSVWCFGFLVTYVYWGITGILIGVVLAGIGVVPIGMLASVINGEWGVMLNLLYGIVLTYGARSYAIYLAEKHDVPELN
jgi:hypothetical protein